jgi:hypothetical protein
MENEIIATASPTNSIFQKKNLPIYHLLITKDHRSLWAAAVLVDYYLNIDGLFLGKRGNFARGDVKGIGEITWSVAQRVFYGWKLGRGRCSPTGLHRR